MLLFINRKLLERIRKEVVTGHLEINNKIGQSQNERKKCLTSLLKFIRDCYSYNGTDKPRGASRPLGDAMLGDCYSIRGGATYWCELRTT